MCDIAKRQNASTTHEENNPMPRNNDRPSAIRTAFKQMPRATALDICEDYREVVARLKRMADNLAGGFVVANGDAARALEAELRMFEEAIDVVSGSMLPEAIDDFLPSKEC
jgi:ribosomal protein S20